VQVVKVKHTSEWQENFHEFNETQLRLLKEKVVTETAAGPR